MSSSVLFVDTETTGLERPEIVQLACASVSWHGDPIRVDFGRSALMLMNGPVSLGALATHHLLPSDLEVGPPGGPQEACALPGCPECGYGPRKVRVSDDG